MMIFPELEDVEFREVAVDKLVVADKAVGR